MLQFLTYLLLWLKTVVLSKGTSDIVGVVPSKTIRSQCASNRFETDRHVKNKDRDHPQAQLFGIESAKSEQYFKTYITESFHYTTFGLGYPNVLNTRSDKIIY